MPDHLGVAAVAAGWRTNISRFPNPNRPENLATIDFSPLAYVTETDRACADAILTRYTDRLPFAPPSN